MGAASPSTDRRSRRLRVAGAAAALALAAGVAGCGDGDRSSLDPASSQSSDIATLWWVMFAISAVVFAAVVALLLVALVRRRGAAPTGTGSGRAFLLVGGVAVPSVVLVVLAVLTIGALPGSTAAGSGDRLVVDVVARQWFWDIAYPQSGAVTANELHVPVGRPVEVRLTSRDVVHSFWVPPLNRKMDAIPGQTNRLILEADRPGVFIGQCAEYCGVQHAHMGIRVIAETPDRFAAWLRAQTRPAPPPTTPEARDGQQILLGSACVYCHTIGGTNATGDVGPDLTHVASRDTLAAGTIPNRPGYLAGWILDPQHFKPGNRMPATDLTGPEVQRLLAYLRTLR